MRMKDHFALPVGFEFDFVLWQGLPYTDDPSEFASGEQMFAVARAINCQPCQS